MNLRARNLGLIILSALTLFSCEEELSTIGLPPENNLGIFFADIPLEDHATQLWVDKINSRGTGVLLAGKYEDPDLGPIEAKNFSEFVLSPLVQYDTLLANATFDSLVYSLRVSDFSGANFENQPQTIQIFQMQDPIDIFGEDSTGVPFYTSSSQALASKIGEGSFIPYPDSVGLSFSESDFPLANASDSLFKDKFFDSDSIYIYRHNIKLDNSFGFNFFNQAQTGGSFKDLTAFRDFLKGLAIVSAASNNVITQYIAEDSQLTLFYTKNGESRSTSFNLSLLRSFNNITPNINDPWGAGPLTGITPYTSYDIPGDKLFLQSGTNLLLKLDLSSLKMLEDSLGNVQVQSAQIRLESRDVDASLRPTSNISMGLTTKDSLNNENYYLEPLIGSLNTNALSFDKDQSFYEAPIPIYIDNLTSDKVEFDQVILFLGNSNNTEVFLTNTRIKKVIINKNSLKLRIYYTIPDKNNN